MNRPAVAQAMSDDEEAIAKQHYAAQGDGPQVRVIEADTASTPRWNSTSRPVASRTEPLVERILEDERQRIRATRRVIGPSAGRVAASSQHVAPLRPALVPAGDCK
jgi:hypothetical protein